MTSLPGPPNPGNSGVLRLQPRLVPLGGLRAMTVRRSLPQRGRTTIGAWCLIDHYGPDAVGETGGMVVAPHPHTGLQTASWLFEGEVDHRDSVGSVARVRPGELNLMTAGQGISHSELSTDDTRLLHGVQLWVVLPDGSRQQAPHFENHVIPAVEVGEWPGSVLMRVFAGSLGGQTAAAVVYTPLLGAELTLAPGSAATLAVDPAFEFGLLVDAGAVTLGSDAQEGEPLVRPELGYLPPGQGSIRIENAGAEPARVVLIGGEPFDEKIVMWWNFIGRSHEEITAWRAEWQSDVFDGANAEGRFGVVPAADAYDGLPLPAPNMPGVRLKPR